MRTLSIRTLRTRSCRAAFSAVLAALSAAMLWTGVATPPAHARASVPQRQFWIVDNGAYKRVACEELGAGIHVTLFNCGGPEPTPADVDVLLRSFDRHIFPTDTLNFGVPRAMGTVNVVMAPLSGMTYGYFDANDLSPLGPSASHSNHGNVLFVRSLASMPVANRMTEVQETIAHELQHLIDYRIRVLDRGLAPQQVWLNEGLSFFAQLANGFWTPRDLLRLEASAFDPAWSLTAMTENPQFLRQHGRVAYGRAGMFVTYLASQYGPRFTRDLVRNRQTGMKGIDVVLRREGRGSCADAFAHWGVAQLLNAPGQYGYKGMLGDHFVPPRLMYPTVTTYPFDSQTAGHSLVVLQPWTQGYIRFVAPQGAPVTIQITAPATVRLAAVYGTSGAPGQSSVRWLKQSPAHTVSIRLSGETLDRDTVTIAMSGGGSLQNQPTLVRSAVVTFRASSVYARHDQRMSRTTSTAGPNADIVL